MPLLPGQSDRYGPEMSPRDAKGGFLPKTSGNPKGRPPGVITVYGAIIKKMNQKYGASDLLLVDQLANALINEALDGEAHAFAAIMNRQNPLVTRNENREVVAFDVETDEIIDRMRETPEGMARLEEVRRETMTGQRSDDPEAAAIAAADLFEDVEKGFEGPAPPEGPPIEVEHE